MTALHASLSSQQLTRPTQYGYRRSVVTNWCELIPGDTVLLTGPDTEQRYAGTVDAVLDDGSLAWIVLANGGGRRLFFHCDGHQMLVDPKGQECP
ncbi:hypothetical protein [Arthrobacter sp. ov118]|uniref:hypothetical protein n=1 Tax=Arthrobacter sp. ov118 TaxID=1761747 RepID=UPI0008EE915A|nr:hypothetical protein [Arthrobacter sp. ov118]SFU11656.1 hypothetical protein SAMN04487915_111153 [Arthrobacter sp. ov118]